MTTMPTIAKAVARAIRNGEIDEVYRCTENIAYIAALDRKGSSFEKQITAALNDASVMRMRTSLPGTPASKDVS